MVAINETEMEISNEEFSNIINNYKVVVVDFFSERCMPCLMMSPVIEDLALEMNDVKFVKMNTEDNPEISCKYNVSTIPCLIVFKDGKETGRLVGAHSYDLVEKKLKEFIGKVEESGIVVGKV